MCKAVLKYNQLGASAGSFISTSTKETVLTNKRTVLASIPVCRSFLPCLLLWSLFSAYACTGIQAEGWSVLCRNVAKHPVLPAFSYQFPKDYGQEGLIGSQSRVRNTERWLCSYAAAGMGALIHFPVKLFLKVIAQVLCSTSNCAQLESQTITLFVFRESTLELKQENEIIKISSFSLMLFHIWALFSSSTSGS